MLTEQEQCTHCAGPVSSDWQGYVIILDYKRSEIAKKMNIEVNGKFALKVR
jgi:DNA-directed RNA polymerase subunit E"